MTVVHTQLVKKRPTLTTAGEAVQAVIGSGAVGEGQSIGDYGYGKCCINFGKAFLQEATGSFHARRQVLES